MNKIFVKSGLSNTVRRLPQAQGAAAGGPPPQCLPPSAPRLIRAVQETYLPPSVHPAITAEANLHGSTAAGNTEIRMVMLGAGACACQHAAVGAAVLLSQPTARHPLAPCSGRRPEEAARAPTAGGHPRHVLLHLLVRLQPPRLPRNLQPALAAKHHAPCSVPCAPHDEALLLDACSALPCACSPTPSASSMIVSHFGMRPDIQAWSLSGMGCGTGVLGINLVADMLKVR